MSSTQSSVAAIHPEKETLDVDVNIPGHEARTATPLFSKTRAVLIERDKVCWVCGATAEESGEPLEAHHHPIERSLANMIDWTRFAEDCKAGLWGANAQSFDWASFDSNDPYTFVDNMLVNGRLLCKLHHTGKDEGIHDLPFPLWVAQKYGKEGYQFTDREIIKHWQGTEDDSSTP